MPISVSATPAERAAAQPGDDIVAAPDVVMDRAFTVPGAPAEVWPWLAQLGKGRAGWYLPRSLERLVPSSHRALRHLDPRWQSLQVGDVVPDYGGAEASFTVARVDPPRSLVYTSRRGRMDITWSLSLEQVTAPADEHTARDEPSARAAAATRVRLRLRLAPVRRRWLATSAGELLDVATIAMMAAGLRERLYDQQRPQ